MSGFYFKGRSTVLNTSNGTANYMIDVNDAIEQGNSVFLTNTNNAKDPIWPAVTAFVDEYPANISIDASGNYPSTAPSGGYTAGITYSAASGSNSEDRLGSIDFHTAAGWATRDIGLDLPGKYVKYTSSQNVAVPHWANKVGFAARGAGGGGGGGGGAALARYGYDQGQAGGAGHIGRTGGIAYGNCDCSVGGNMFVSVGSAGSAGNGGNGHESPNQDAHGGNGATGGTGGSSYINVGNTTSTQAKGGVGGNGGQGGNANANGSNNKGRAGGGNLPGQNTMGSISNDWYNARFSSTTNIIQYRGAAGGGGNYGNNTANSGGAGSAGKRGEVYVVWKMGNV